MSVRLLRVMLAMALIATVGAVKPSMSAGNSCSWPSRLDSTVANALYPDQFANYWVMSLPTVPGATLTIRGRYPHARYMSFVTYNAVLQSVDGLNDREIAPDPGNVNPFQPGAPRDGTNRDYTVTVAFGAPQPNGPANTLYTTSEDGTKSAQLFLIAYRVFRADRGLDERGGVGLPDVTLNLPGGATVPIPQCEVPGVPDSGVNNTLAGGDSPIPSAGGSGVNPPAWHKFYNFPTSITHATDSERGTQLSDGMKPYTTMFPKGGFADNPDNNYISAFVNRSRGKVLVLRGTLPTTPDTYQGALVMGDGQLRYWSLCTNHAPSQRYYACLADDQVVTDAAGTFTIVISQPQDRPAAARAENGVTWLPWGLTNDGVLILRNMLPAQDFAGSIQAARYDHEAQDMGAYYPRACYLPAAADFPSASCPA